MIFREKGYTLTRLATTPEFFIRMGWAGSTTVLPFLFAQDTAGIIFTRSTARSPVFKDGVKCVAQACCAWFDEKKVRGPMATDDDTGNTVDYLFVQG